MGLNGMGLSSLVMARRIMGYIEKHSYKIEIPKSRQSTAHHTPKDDKALIQGQDRNQKKIEPAVQTDAPRDFSPPETNLYTLKHSQPGVEKIIPPGKTIKREV
ncbi:MAG: hypothetical protein CL609_02350 [Anaerolineaceae bacterium]|nr:hypothetical protein [Anaerolineaceae bacterium]